MDIKARLRNKTFLVALFSAILKVDIFNFKYGVNNFVYSLSMDE